MRTGPFYPDYGLDRIVAYHERQDARFAEAAAATSRATGKPILTATELAVADPTNPGPATVRATGRLCYATANRAVTALGHLYRYARWRERPRAVAVTAGRSRWRTLLVVLAVVVRRGRRPGHRPALVATDAGQAAAATTTTTSDHGGRGADPPRDDAACCRPGGCPALVDGAADHGDAPPAPGRRRRRPRRPPGASSCRSTARPIQDLRGDSPVIPASNQKLVTAAVALDALGGDHRFVTSAVAPAAPVDGVLRGDLTIVGGGDPVLTTAPYLAWLPVGRQGAAGPAHAVRGAGRPDRGGRRAPHRGQRGGQRQALRRRAAGGQLAGGVPALGRRWPARRPAGQRRLHVVRAGPVGHRSGAARGPGDDAAAGGAWRHRRRARRRCGPASGTTQVAAIASPPLTDIVREMLTHERQQHRPSCC